jgi:hypothetical protein
MYQYDHIYCSEAYNRYVQLETTFWETAVSGHMIRWNCQVLSINCRLCYLLMHQTKKFTFNSLKWIQEGVTILPNNARENKLRKLSWIMSRNSTRRGWRRTDSSHLESNAQGATLPFSVLQFKSPHLASLQLLKAKAANSAVKCELWIFKKCLLFSIITGWA